MTSVANAISVLLYNHDTVIVPGLGAFLCHVEGAKVNVITNQFERPSATLNFDPQQREENDLVVNYLAANDGITVEEARQLVMGFVSDLFAKLKAGERVDIPDVGSLSYGENQELVFNAAASNDFNGDAFGLEDFNPEPVYGTGNEKRETEPAPQDTKSEPQELEQDAHDAEQKSTDSSHRRHHYWWIWLLLLLAVAGVAWWYFKFRPASQNPQPKVITNDTVVITNDTVLPVNDTVVHVNDTVAPTNDTVVPASDTVVIVNDTVVPANDTVTIDNDTVSVVPENPPVPMERPVEVVRPEATSKAFIVGGCFSVEQNALKMTAEAREQGCADAFVMKRGSKFFVCYGQYPSTADAKAALREVLTNYNPKAWILTK